jgi:hypothetical protein
VRWNVVHGDRRAVARDEGQCSLQAAYAGARREVDRDTVLLSAFLFWVARLQHWQRVHGCPALNHVDEFLGDQALPVVSGNGRDNVLLAVPVVEGELCVLGRSNAEIWHPKPDIVDSVLIDVSNCLAASETEDQRSGTQYLPGSVA